MKRLFVLLPLLLAVTTAMAQNSGISGTVTDASTGNPIQYARVHTHCGMAYTDNLGCYQLMVRPGRYVVNASATGYEPAVYPETVTVVQGQITPDIDFALKPAGGGGNGGISGEVTSAAGGRIIQGAEVVASGNGIVRRVMQGCHGYTIPNLPPGMYWVSASACGYERGAYPESVLVAQGQVTPDIDFTLTPAGGGELGAIAGTVTDKETGEPIPHARVSTRCVSAFTDSSGDYTIRNLRPGRYVVVAGAQGYQMQVYPDTVVVEPGQTVEGIDFALVPQGGGQCGAIAGRVTDKETGELVRGAVVFARGNGIVREVTQCCHGYKIGNLPAGKYFVGAAAPGYEPGSYPDSVEVVAGQVTDHIDFALEPRGGGQAGGISGLVTDEETGKPVFGAYVCALGPTPGRANTNHEGFYAIRNLAPGTYVVVARARGYETSAPQTVEVVAGQMTEDVDFALKPFVPAVPGAVAGTVIDEETGEPVFMAVVFTWGPNGQGHAMTDSFGRYLMTVRPGRYLVRACARGYYPALYPDTVLVVENETVFGIDFALEPAGLRAGGVAGFVYDGEAQTELRNARVTAIGPNGSFETTTNEHGEYLFDNLEPGDYRIEVAASGYAEELYPELVTVEASDIVSFTSPAVYPLTGIEESPARTPAVRRLVAEPSMVVTSGRILWQVPVAGHVTVRVFDNSGRVVRTIQDGYQNSGRYSAVWQADSDRGERIANGVYFYRLDAPTCQDVRKVVVASR